MTAMARSAVELLAPYELSQVKCPGKEGCGGFLSLVESGARNVAAIAKCTPRQSKGASMCCQTYFGVDAVLKWMLKEVKEWQRKKGVRSTLQFARNDQVEMIWHAGVVEKMNGMVDNAEEMARVSDQLVGRLTTTACVALAASLKKTGEAMDVVREAQQMVTPVRGMLHVEPGVIHRQAEMRKETYADAVRVASTDEQRLIILNERKAAMVRARPLELSEADKKPVMIHVRGINTERETVQSFKEILYACGVDRRRLLWISYAGPVKTFFVIPSYEREFKEIMAREFRNGDAQVEFLTEYNPRKAGPLFVQGRGDEEVRACHRSAELRFAYQLRRWQLITPVGWVRVWLRNEIECIAPEVLSWTRDTVVPSWQDVIQQWQQEEEMGRDQSDVVNPHHA